MEKSGCKMYSTDGLIGKGVYDKKKKYKKYNGEHYYRTLQNIYRRKNSNLLEKGFPEIWTLNFLKIHNCIICSSVLMEKEILQKIKLMNNLKNGREDYGCWKRALEHTNSVYIEDICFYYDSGNGNGRNY